uniref:HAT C-terminal dimerisation domain-containing protein n=1 Tax=Triticum urartu TaxID=4572 RepID=A0A8R7Q0E5_TRIUA
MQVSTVASESAFSAGGRVVDPFRGCLEPETVEALICTKSWIGASKGSDIASVVKDMDMPSLEERLQLWCTWFAFYLFFDLYYV